MWCRTAISCISCLMCRLVAILMFFMGVQVLRAERPDSLLVMFWNLENFFDYRNDSTSVSDEEFSAAGVRHWNKSRFETKCRAVAKSVLWIGSDKGRLPDVIGVAEVENEWVLRHLVEETALRKAGYCVVHFDSPDVRGIDVGLLYREEVWEKVKASPVRMPFATRDILLVQLRHRGDGRTWSFLVNHFPSKYGGVEESLERRRVTAGRLKAVGDSLAARGDSLVVAMGDFNDTPESEAFEELDETFVNVGGELHRRGEGTIRFEGKWELIDMFFVPASLSERCGMSLVKIPFLLTRDTVNAGEKPLRTYTGPRYSGGVSDHLPILLEVRL